MTDQPQNEKVAGVLSRLDSVKRSGSGWTAKCPTHDDNTASLAIGEGDDGGVLLHCHAGCEFAAIVKSLGLAMADVMPPENGSGKSKMKIVAEYDYRDECGELLYQAVRLDPKDFRQRRPKEGGGWVWKLEKTRRVLYRLLELLAADPTRPVFVPEGEKDVDRLGSLDVVATCNVGGAGKWRQEYCEHLRGRHVVVLADNDAAGRKHAEQVAGMLQGIAASVRVLYLPDLPEKGDVSDWLDAGGDADKLLALARATAEWKPTAAETTTTSQTTTTEPTPEPTTHRTAPAVTNATIQRTDDGTKTIPLPMRDVIASIQKAANDWPRRVDSALFIHDESEIAWLTSTPALFGWLSSIDSVRWHRGVGCVTKEETFHELRRVATRYLAIERFPHEPIIDGHFYACGMPEAGNGDVLRRLLDRFEPATPIDRDLIQAMFMTAFWGGHGGTRPCFVVTSDHGRGAGKSKMAEMVAHTCGGQIDLSHNEEIAKLKSRLLSPEALPKRVAILDNIKSLRFSWGELEGLITAPAISGHRMYVGEGQRPNTLLWVLTLNGASLSTDMAQRSVIIKIRKPKRTGTWEEDTIRFILDNRQAIIADIIGCLRAEPMPLAKFTRWGTWEAAVLSRLPEPGEAQAVILERQGQADVEEEEAGILEEHFAAELERLGYDVDSDEIHIPNGVAARWYNTALNDRQKVGSVSRILKQMSTEGRLRRIEPNPSRKHGRGFRWVGESWTINQSRWVDLPERLENQNRGYPHATLVIGVRRDGPQARGTKRLPRAGRVRSARCGRLGASGASIDGKTLPGARD